MKVTVKDADTLTAGELTVNVMCTIEYKMGKLFVPNGDHRKGFEMMKQNFPDISIPGNKGIVTYNYKKDPDKWLAALPIMFHGSSMWAVAEDFTPKKYLEIQ